MIFYDRTIEEEANFCDDAASPKTGIEYTYTYYMELSKAFSNRTLKDEQYFDYCVAHRKYKWYK